MNDVLHRPTLPNVVYHYCSVETFYHIITNKTIRLSDIEKSNDFMEKKWAIRRCLHYIENNITNPDYSCSKQPEKAIALLREIQQQFRDYNTMILAACFSSKRDLLSQWRGYGDNGYGVCIGISSGTEFKPAFGRTDRFFDLNQKTLPVGLIFHCIKYTTEQIEQLCMHLFCEQLNALSENCSLEEASGTLVHLLYPTLPFFKSSAFSEEAEWRCVYYPPLPAPPYEMDTFDEDRFQQLLAAQVIEKEFDDFHMLPLSYRLRQNNLVPYRDLSFAESCDHFIQNVTIGPKCPLDRETVKLFLEQRGIHLPMSDIYLSDVSYR